ncbi:hypothetical protein GLOIN_2v1789471 [Rhizophagus irregularis DAOM 181602=DAOM 197198]|nr:hypothetical protein GLOIN_2v1789471 [Rhizophagus irregularis DAOM 181602=DAOM 197198]
MKQRVNGQDFLDLTREELEQHEMKLGLAKRLVKFAKEYDEAELIQCIKEIKCRLGNIETTLADSNEAMRCEITKKELTLAPQLKVVSEESTGRGDYAIKALEELICITEGKLHQVVMVCLEREFGRREGVAQECEAGNGGYCWFRVDIEKEPATERQRVQEYFENRNFEADIVKLKHLSSEKPDHLENIELRSKLSYRRIMKRNWNARQIANSRLDASR